MGGSLCVYIILSMYIGRIVKSLTATTASNMQMTIMTFFFFVIPAPSVLPTYYLIVDPELSALHFLQDCVFCIVQQLLPIFLTIHMLVMF